MDSPGVSDLEVLSTARSEERTILTFDKDFGELVFRQGVAVPSGVLLFRVLPASPTYVAELACAVLQSRADWAGHFSVIDQQRIRMTRLPRPEL